MLVTCPIWNRIICGLGSFRERGRPTCDDGDGVEVFHVAFAEGDGDGL